MNYLRVNLLGLLEILNKYSDDEHILSIDQIKSYMENEYGFSPDRRSIYKAIDSLTDFGYDISKYNENGKGYFLRERIFESSEISLLSDMLYHFKFIEPRQKQLLDKKLHSFTSVYKGKKFKLNDNINKRTDKIFTSEIFLNVEILKEAIIKKKKVSFMYLKYDLNKQLVPRKNSIYVVNPFILKVQNSKYYLICTKEPYTNISFYRLDLMKNVKILDDNSIIMKDEDIQKQIENSIYAFSGKPENVILRCKNLIIDYLLEDFGNNISIEKEDDEFFIANFKAPTKGIVYWALQFLEYVEVIEPKNIRYEIIRIIDNNIYKNQN